MDLAAKATCLGGAWGGPLARAHQPPRRTVAFTLIELPVVRKCETAGFTLIELMVVLTLVMLISAIALPSVARMFDSGADAMAYNLISAQLESARMYALENGTPAGIHVQLADRDANPDLAGVQYVTVIAYDNDPAVLKFTQAAGHVPRAMPGSMVAGNAEKFSSDGNWEAISDPALEGDFTTFSMVFDAKGVLIRTVDGQNIKFKTDGDGLFSGDTKLWDPPAEGQEEPAVTALTIFNYAEASLLNPAQRRAYLNQSAQYLPVNFYTGMLYFRKGQ